MGALAALGLWLLSLGDGSVVTTSLAVVGLALMGAAWRIAVARQGPSASPGSPTASSLEPCAAAREPAFDHHPRQKPTPSMADMRWSLDVFAAIDAQRFAAVCETWFAWAGFDTRTDAHRTAEGVDIWLHAARAPEPVAIVRCKHWFNRPVGLHEMEEFSGLVASCRCAHGTYTTTSTYTPEALQFAHEHGIDAVDGRGLLRRIQTRTRQRQQALLAVAFSGQG